MAIWFADWFGVDRIREVFVAVTEPLIEFLTFDKGVPAGLPILIGLCVVGGVVGGFARTAPVAIRRPVTAGVLAVILFGLLQRIVPIVFVELGFEADWLYRRGSGLTFLGGIVVFVIAAGANAAWNRDARAARANGSARACSRRRPPGSGCWWRSWRSWRSCRSCWAP